MSQSEQSTSDLPEVPQTNDTLNNNKIDQWRTLNGSSVCLAVMQKIASTNPKLSERRLEMIDQTKIKFQSAKKISMPLKNPTQVTETMNSNMFSLLIFQNLYILVALLRTPRGQARPCTTPHGPHKCSWNVKQGVSQTPSTSEQKEGVSCIWFFEKARLIGRKKNLRQNVCLEADSTETLDQSSPVTSTPDVIPSTVIVISDKGQLACWICRCYLEVHQNHGLSHRTWADFAPFIRPKTVKEWRKEHCNCL